MNFILPHSFELDLRRECHYLVHRSFSFRVIQIRRSVQKLSSLGSPSADLFEREGFYFTDCSVIRFIDAQERLLLLCFYTGEASRLWWASVLLLSEPRQSVRTVRVPYRPSVFAPFCLKSAGLALIWASAVLLWFLALLYTTKAELSIRRVYNKWDVFLHQKSKKLGYINCTKMFGPFVDDLWKKARNRRRTLMCSENLCYHSRQWMVVAQRSQTKVPSSGFFFCFGAVNVFHNR